MTAVYDLVMVPGHCSACRSPARRSEISGNWWHQDGPCEWRSLTVYQPVDITPCRSGFAVRPARVDLPARFIPTQETALTAARNTFGGDQCRR